LNQTPFEVDDVSVEGFWNYNYRVFGLYSLDNAVSSEQVRSADCANIEANLRN
jgi:hypothetical protein